MSQPYTARDEAEEFPDLAAGDPVDVDSELDPATFVVEDPDGDTEADPPGQDVDDEPAEKPKKAAAKKKEEADQ